MWKVTVCTVLSICCANLACASLRSFTAQEMYERSDMVVVSERLKKGDGSGRTMAVLRNLYFIKGEKTEILMVCYDDSFDEGLNHTVEGRAIYFLKKNNGCLVGSVGYKSIVNFMPNSNCVFSGDIHLEQSNPNGAQPFENFVSHLLGDKYHVLPDFLKGNDDACRQNK